MNMTDKNAYIPFTFHQIGIIRTPHTKPEETPAQPVYARGLKGLVELFPEYEEGLKDLDGFSHIYLLYPFHRAEKSCLVFTPYLDKSPRGIFSTRAPCRPNALGISLVRLIRREGRVLHIEDVDILDQTPLLDIKPYVTRFDSVENALCGWQDSIDEPTARKRGRRKYLPSPTPDQDESR